MNRNNTLTDVANAALALMGETPLNSIEATDSKARVLRLRLEAVIRQEQQLFDWHELREVAELTRFADAKADAVFASEGLYSFMPPADHLQTREASGVFYPRGGRMLALGETLTLTYTRYCEEPAGWSPELFDVVAGALAADTCTLISQNAKLAGELLQKFLTLTRPRAHRMQGEALGRQNYRDNDTGRWQSDMFR